MSNFLACLLVEFTHDQTWPHLRIFHNHLFNEHYKLRLKETSFVYFQFMIMHYLEFIHSFVQTNLVVPLESYVYWAAALPWSSFCVVVEVSISESWLVSKVAAKTKEYKLSVPVFLLIYCKHDPVYISKLAVCVNSIKDTCKCFWKMSEVVTKARVSCSPLLFQSKLSHI